jgi:hypothetical protein
VLISTIGVLTINTTFNVTISNPCLTSSISVPAFSTPLAYYVSDPAPFILISPFTSTGSTSICGGFEYTATQNNGSLDVALDNSIFTFGNLTTPLVFESYTDDVNQVGSYVITITGKQGIYLSSSVNFTVDI